MVMFVDYNDSNTRVRVKKQPEPIPFEQDNSTWWAFNETSGNIVAMGSNSSGVLTMIEKNFMAVTDVSQNQTEGHQT